jgi:hypothetical protein
MSDDINWKEIGADKSIDAVLIPVGLFAALWFQGWVDDRKEREDYASLIADFRNEAETNSGRSVSLEATIGPFADTAPETVLGPISEKYDALTGRAAHLAKTFDCFDLFVDAAAEYPVVLSAFTGSAPAEGAAPAVAPAEGEPAAPAEGEPAPAEGEPAPAEAAPAPAEAPAGGKAVPEELQAELAACAAVLESDEAAKFKPFAGADFSPVYQYVIWQVYLQSGIRLFKDDEAKDLGKKLGAVYASKREVEKRVEEVEVLYNDGLMDATAKLAALEGEFENLFPEEPTIEDLKAIQERIRELSGEAIEVAYEVENSRAVLGLKVGLLKRHMTGMQGELDAAMKVIDSEQRRVGGGSAPAPAAPAAPAPAAPAPAAPAPAAPTKG